MTWHRVAALDELAEGRAKTVTAGLRTVCLTRFEGTYGALDNHCPHQGGPLGEGTIEGCWLRCPWHGYDFHPLTGEPPDGFSDALETFAVEERPDGIYVGVPATAAPVRTVSEVLLETLGAWGLTHVFGMVGHSNLGFADAMRTAQQRGDLTYVGVRHEGAAAFAATAYGKLTGRLAACFAIAGPGSTNLLTGLYDAKVDRAPVLAICGQVPSAVRGRGAFQDLDLTAAFSDVAAYQAVVVAGSDYAELAALAAKTALVERGVAQLVLPDEVQVAPAGDVQPAAPEGRVGDLRTHPPRQSLTAAVELLDAASRPIVVVGAGARDDMAAIIGFAETLGAPVLTTFKAKGQISDAHPLAAGVVGRSGTPVASWFMNECDLIVTFGASFSNHSGIAPYKPTIAVDRDPMALGRFHPVDVGVLGDVGVAAQAFCDEMSPSTARADQRTELTERWARWRAEKASRASEESPDGVSAAAVFAALTDAVAPDAVICVDVGNNTYSFGRYFEVAHQQVLMSGYLGSIGFALPAAMGAWAAVSGTADDQRQIVSVSGDGGFGQYMGELTTAVRYEMNITHVLANNSSLGKIAKEQRDGGHEVWQTGLTNPDFAAYARLCGAHGAGVTTAAELPGALRAALAHDGPALVDVRCDPLLI